MINLDRIRRDIEGMKKVGDELVFETVATNVYDIADKYFETTGSVSNISNTVQSEIDKINKKIEREEKRNRAYGWTHKHKKRAFKRGW